MNRRLVISLAAALMLSSFGASAAITVFAATAAEAASPSPTLQPATVKATVAAVPAATTTEKTKHCHDAKGKFVKCETAKPVAAVRCRDDKGKFIACKK